MTPYVLCVGIDVLNVDDWIGCVAGASCGVEGYHRKPLDICCKDTDITTVK